MRCWLCSTFLVLCAVTPAAAANNPRIKLKLQRATPAEAAAALSRVSGEKVEYQPPDRPMDKPVADPDGAVPERADFDWNDLSFARALRQVSDRFNLAVARDWPGRGYLLQTRGPNPRPKPSEKFPGFVETKGYRFWVTQLSMESRRNANFRDDQPQMGAGATGRLQLQILTELPEGDVEPVVGLGNVTARDDTGNLLLMEVLFPAGYRLPRRGNAFPDIWDESVHLSAPHPRAKRLVWVEGDLIAHTANQDRALMVPIPVPAEPASRQLGEATVENLKLERRATGTEIRLTYSVPRGDGPLIARTDLELALVGASGKQYDSRGGGAQGSTREGRTIWDMTYTIDTGKDPVTQLILKRTERSKPVTIAHFRMQNIPLPPEGIFIARPNRQPLPQQLGPAGRAPAPEPEPAPFREAGGAVLVSRVLIGRKPAPLGSLSLGLRRKEGGEWGAIRWQELEIPTGGTIRLPDLQPGNYQVFRLYGPKERLNLPGPGAWRGAEVEIEAAAGKEVALPPLEWQPDLPTAPPKPVTAVKPKGLPKK